MTTTPGIRIALAGYRLLLRLLPRADRGHRREMLALAEETLAARRGAGAGRFLVAVLATYADVFRRAWHGRVGRHRPAIASLPSERASILETLLQDLHFALRSMRLRPLFTLGVVLTLGMGIGANTAMFSVVDTVLRRPLPFRDGDELVRIYLMRNGQPPWLSPRAPVLEAVRDGARSFESVAGQRLATVTLSTADGPVRVRTGGVTAGWLETLGIEPAVGRGFTRVEEQAGRESGVVLASHGFWQDRHGGSPELLGSTLTLDDSPYTVVGILPPGFSYPYDNELYVPLNPTLEPGGRWAFNIQGRLREGVDVEAALLELRSLTEELRGRVEGFGPEMELLAVPLRRVLLDDEEDLVTGLFAAVGLLLLIACANVGSLLLARSSARRRELAIRSALGASRTRQIRQLVTESLMLSAAAGAVGVLLAAWTRDLLRGLLPGRMGNVVSEVPLDGRVLVFALGAAVITGLLFGVPLAIRNSDVKPERVMREGGRGGSSRTEHRLLDGFVVAELGLVVALLCGAGAMVDNVTRQSRVDPGFESEGLYTVVVSLEEDRYEEAELRRRFVDAALGAVRAIPGVRGVGATTIFPAAQRGNTLAGLRRPGTGEDSVLQVNSRLVTPGFLETLGVPLLRGRLVDETDASGNAPVAVLSRRAAELLFPEGDAIGGRVVETRRPEQPVTVVGIVADVREEYGIDATWYLPYDQHADSGTASSLILTVRAEDPTSLTDGIRRAVWTVDPTLPLFDAATATELRGETLQDERFGTWLISGFAAIGLVLGGLGLYSLVSFTVARRIPEIGVRLALGARPADVVRGLIRRSLARVLVGAALGLVGAIALIRLLGSVVAGTESLGPVPLAAVATLLGGVCLLASWIPARRAAHLDPSRVLQGG